MKGLFTSEGRKKAAQVCVYGSENWADEATKIAYSPQAIERRIEELLWRISKKVCPVGSQEVDK